MTPTHFRFRPDRPATLTPQYVKREYGLLIARVNDAETNDSPDAWMQLLKEWNELYAYVRGESSRISYRYSQAMDDPLLEEADRVYRDEVSPSVADGEFALVRALLSSRHRDALTGTLGLQLIRRYELTVTSLDQANRDLRVEAGRLAQSYARRLAKAEIELDGRRLTLQMAGSFGMSDDAEVRRSAFLAVRGWFIDQREELAATYDRLVRIRTQMARNVGFDDFVPLGYQGMGRTDFGTQESASFRESVRTYAVPLLHRLHEHQRDSIGVDRLSPWDAAFDPSTTLPRGVAPVDEQLDRASALFAALHPTLADHFSRMRQEGLIDLENRAAKRAGAFCTGFPDEPRAAILCNSVGDADDVRTLIHEMGHAFQKWESTGIASVLLQHPTSETAEIHSMGMEYLSLPLIDCFFTPQDAIRFRRGRWRKAVSLLCYACVVDEFQHWVYEHHEASPEDRDAQWCTIWDAYHPGIDYEGRDDVKSARWYQQSHIFQAPFYYIDYAIAEIIAMQLAALDQRDHETAMSTYLALCRMGGTRSILGVVESAGLRSPFDPTTIRDVMRIAEQEAGVGV